MKERLLAELKRSLEAAGLWQKNALLLAAVSGITPRIAVQRADPAGGLRLF